LCEKKLFPTSVLTPTDFEAAKGGGPGRARRAQAYKWGYGGLAPCSGVHSWLRGQMAKPP